MQQRMYHTALQQSCHMVTLVQVQRQRLGIPILVNSISPSQVQAKLVVLLTQQA
jgi:hypothetical protein